MKTRAGGNPALPYLEGQPNMKDLYFCYDCNTPAHFFCKKCGVPICRKCNNHQDGMCKSCYDTDMDDNEDTYEFTGDVTV